MCDCLLDVTPWGQVGVPKSTLESLCVASREGTGRLLWWRSPDTGPSVLQLRHFIQVRSQHFRSFYVVMPVELFILGVGAVIS